jgi:hypothetical protein
MKKILLIFIFLAIVSMGSVQAQESLKMEYVPDETFLKPLETALLSYQNDFKKWPENIMDLQTYANQTGHPLDLSIFEKITLERRSSDTVLIVYAQKNPEPYLSAYAITVIDRKLTKGTNKDKTSVLEVSSLSPEQERLRNTLKTKMWPNELASP